jgi:hypothetical protein
MISPMIKLMYLTQKFSVFLQFEIKINYFMYLNALFYNFIM